MSGKAGTCTSEKNTATVGSAQTPVIDTNSATAVLCIGSDLTVDKIVNGSFTRTYPWSIDKVAKSDKVTVDGQGNATGSYDVTVTAGAGVDSAWAMSGTVTVTNPNDWQAASITGITDTYDGGGTCTVTTVSVGGGTPQAVSFPYSLAKGATAVFGYSCTFAAKPAYDGTNSATVSWSAGFTAPHPSATGTAPVTEGTTWSKTLVNDTVTITDDHATPGDVSDDTVLGTLQLGGRVRRDRSPVDALVHDSAAGAEGWHVCRPGEHRERGRRRQGGARPPTTPR